eukprot:NODE_54_length_3010_cov_101.106139_g42_i1.p1 GENE.NODE_54_length_3010_cov_101.106139_g42_i1~~NODE_54_length_3010_cov_101.106139_g42_i1.p1  ORF type:complete len:972 (+),score=336.88 NODE_54_length_3010_cov_101.106139_g42_i1:80-2995(+)
MEVLSNVILGVKNGDLDRVNTWLRSTACDVNARDTKGSTVLHWACHVGNEEMASALLRHGANPNLGNAVGATPLHWACKNSNVGLVQELLNNGADPSITNDRSTTAIQVARQCGSTPVVALLEAAPVSQSDGSDAGGMSSEAVSAATTPRRRQQSVTSSPTSSCPDPQKRSAFAEQVAGVASNAQVQELQAQVRALSKEKAQLEGKTAAFADLKRRLELVQKEKLKLEIEVKQRSLQEQNKLREQTDQHDSDKAAQQQQSDLNVMAMAQAKSEAETKLQLAEEQAQRFRSERTELDAQLASRKAEVADCRALIGTLQKQKTRAELEAKRVEDLRQTVSELNREKTLLELEASEVSVLKETVAEMTEERTNMESTIRRLEQQFADTNAKRIAAESQCDTLRAEVKRVNAANSEVEQVKQERARLQVKLDCMQEELDRRAATNQTNAADADERTDSLANEVLRLQSEKASMVQQCADLQGRCDSQTEDLRVLREARERLQAKVDELIPLQAQVATNETQINRLQSDCSAARTAVHEKAEELASAQREVAALQAEIDEARAAKEELISYEQQALDMQTELQDSAAQVVQLQNDLLQAEAEKEAAVRQARDAGDVGVELEKVKVERDLLHKEVVGNKANTQQLLESQRLAEAQRRATEVKARQDAENKASQLQLQVVQLEGQVTAVRQELNIAESTISQLSAATADKESAAVSNLAEQKQINTRINQEKADTALALEQARVELAALREAAATSANETAAASAAAEAKLREVQAISDAGRNQLRTQLETSQAHAEALQNRLDSAIRDANAAQGQMQTKLAQQHQRITQLEAESEGVEGMRQQLQRRALLMDQERSALQSQIRLLQEQATMSLDLPSKASNRLSPMPMAQQQFNNTAPPASGYGFDAMHDPHSLRAEPVPPLAPLRNAPVAKTSKASHMAAAAAAATMSSGAAAPLFSLPNPGLGGPAPGLPVPKRL